MKFVNDILSDLVEKKLWPVAALLTVLLVAVPMQLAKAGDPPPVAEVPASNVQEDTGPQLALTRATKTGFERAPRVNKSSLDPFAERTDAQAKAVLALEKKQLSSAIDSALGTDTSGGVTVPGDSGGGIVPETPSEPSDPTPTDPKETEETDDLLSILVTVGDGQPTTMTDIRTLSPLPDATNPFLVYTGKSSTGAAVFIVSADVAPSGDGSCDPTPQDCRTLTLAEGQTEDFKLTTAGGGNVTITVIGVETGKVKTTGVGARATALEAKARKVGGRVVKDALDDPSILKSLVEHKVRLRH